MAMRSLEEGADGLGLDGEHEWLCLRRQFELAADPWIGFIFCPAPRPVVVLRERTEFMLRYRAKKLRRITPGSPDALRGLMPQLFESVSQADCVWVEVIAVDGPLSGDEVGPWAAAWDWLMLRLNERRDALFRRLQGALIFAVHPTWKPRTRNAAPDLWSVRSLVLELAGNKSGDGPDRPSVSAWTSEADDDAEYTPNVRDALAAVQRLAATSSPDPQSLGRSHMRAASALLAADRISEAVEHAGQALATLQSRRLRAQALRVAARAKRADNDVAAALHHLSEAVGLWRSMLDEIGETPQGIRHLSASLNRVGDLHEFVGDTVSARAAYEESLALRRRLVKATGKRPRSIRDLSVSLVRLGDSHHSSGDLASARAAYEESLALRRRLVEVTGETRRSLRDLSVSLERLGDTHHSSGDVASARAAYKESLARRRWIVEAMGETRQALRDLSVSLDRMGDAYRSSGSMSSARTAYEESLALCRRLVEAAGETRRSLRDLSVSLNKVGDLHQSMGDAASAKAAYEESLALCRRLVETTGEAPSSLRGVSVSLERMGDLHRSAGDLASARAAYEESLALRRRLVETTGETRRELRRLSGSLNRIGIVHEAAGDMVEAKAAYEESSALRRQLDAMSG